MSQNIAETESRGFEYGVIHWRSKHQGVLVDQLEQSLQIKTEQVRELFMLGAIYNSHARLTDWKLMTETSPAHTYLRLHTKPRRFDIDIQWNERIVFLNDDFLVVNKPAGVPCHPTVDNIQENILCALGKHLNHDLHITHRLDIGTCGLLVLAKNKKFQTDFNRELKLGRVKKYYDALVDGIAPWKKGDLLTHWLEPSPRAPKTMSKTETNGWAECRLRILDCQADHLSKQSRLSIELLTGRTHQIRAQLATEGHPLVGDRIYGSTQVLKAELLAANQQEFLLQSRLLDFEHLGKQYSFDLKSFDSKRLKTVK